MKLQHLAIGDRFEYEGRIFVKTGPLTASSEDGGQQIIPRYALLTPINTGSKSSPASRQDHTAIRAAFEDFYRTAERLAAPEAHAELAAAREGFLAKLG